MLSFLEFRGSLSTLPSDGEVAARLEEFFSAVGDVDNATRFQILDETDKRRFLVKFKHPADAARVASQYKLRSFAFDSVLFDVGCSSRSRP